MRCGFILLLLRFKCIRSMCVLPCLSPKLPSFPFHCRPCNVILDAKVLLEGEAFSGKTALMAHTSVKSDFPFIRKISADEMIGYGEV